MTAGSGWIGVDFDRTLARHEHAQGLALGEPIPRVVRMVKRWIAAGYDVRILTARVCSLLPAEEREAHRRAVMNWCAMHLGKALPVTSEKDFHMWVLFDDRAVNVIPNIGMVDLVDIPEELR